MNCIVIDDEPLAIDLLMDYIDKIPYLDFKKSFTNPIEGLTFLQESKVDLVFLDVELPFLSGIEFVRCMQSKPQIIFTSAYEKYALAGYDLEITDYLIKPILFERFFKAVSKAYSRYKAQMNSTGYKEMPAVTEKESHLDFIMVKTGYNTVNLSLNDILYIEGLKDYVKIYTQDKTIMTLNSLKRLQDILPETRFIRVHRSFIVALQKIDSIQRNRIVIGKNYVPVGENFKNAFKDAISCINL